MISEYCMNAFFCRGLISKAALLPSLQMFAQVLQLPYKSPPGLSDKRDIFMGGPATASTSHTTITNISLPFPLVFSTDTLHSATRHHTVKAAGEVRESHSEEPGANKSTLSCGKQKGLFKFTMIK